MLSWLHSRKGGTMKTQTIAVLALSSCTAISPVGETSQALDAATRSNIKHLVVVMMENHSFDNYFGDWCMAGSLTPMSPTTCDAGWGCCETAFTSVSSWSPKNQPQCPNTWGTGAVIQATDGWNQWGNVGNSANDMLGRMSPQLNGSQVLSFGMNNFTCPWNVNTPPWQPAAIQMSTIPWNGGSDHLTRMFGLAQKGALADRYFQPIAGASASNTMFFATGGFVFQDGDGHGPKYARSCTADDLAYEGATIGLRMDQVATPVSWRNYFQGYANVGWSNPPICFGSEPDNYHPTDNSHTFFPTGLQVGATIGDAHTGEYDWWFQNDVTQNALPAVSFIKPLGRISQHPYQSTISLGELFVERIYATLFGGTVAEGSSCPPPAAGGTCTCSGGSCSTVYPVSSAATTTLLLVTFDESGGFYDHVAPPILMADGNPLPRAATDSPVTNIWNAVDWAGNPVPQSNGDPECFRCQVAPSAMGRQIYGPRVPLLALGPFARQYWGTGYISHVTMEHSSIVKFIEWNWSLASLGRRDDHVNNLGSLINDSPAVVGTVVPEGVHELCATGAALVNSVGSVGAAGRGIGSTPRQGTVNGMFNGSLWGNGCVDLLCGIPGTAGVDPFCCQAFWDSICVAEVTSRCGLTCPGN
jgi:phospholipase C